MEFAPQPLVERAAFINVPARPGSRGNSHRALGKTHGNTLLRRLKCAKSSREIIVIVDIFLKLLEKTKSNERDVLNPAKGYTYSSKFLLSPAYDRPAVGRQVMLYARLAGRARWFKRIWKEPLDHADATRLRTEQLSAVLRYTPVMMMANACNALVLMVAFWGTSSQASVLYWGATLFSVVGFICFRRCLPRAVQKSTARRLHRMRAAIFNALALGTCWAAVPLFFWLFCNFCG